MFTRSLHIEEYPCILISLIRFFLSFSALVLVALPSTAVALSYVPIRTAYPYTGRYTQGGYPVYETPYVKVVDETRRGRYRYSDDRYYRGPQQWDSGYSYNDPSRGSLSHSQKASRWPRYFESPSHPLKPHRVTSDRYIQYLNDRQNQYRVYPYEETYPYFPQKYYHPYDDPHFYRKKMLNTRYREMTRNTYYGNNSYDNYDSYFYNDGHQTYNRYGH